MLIPFGVLLYAGWWVESNFPYRFYSHYSVTYCFVYMNTAVLTSDQVGGIDGLYDKIIEVSKTKFIEGNYDGSILTGKSKGSVIFGLVLTAGNFGLTVMDSSFWQKHFQLVQELQFLLIFNGILIFSNVWPISAIIGGSLHFGI